jgi:RHS repeat-associated protein
VRASVRSSAFCLAVFTLVQLLLCGGIARAQGSVLEARGEASYRVPIVVPPGPAGHQPNLELVYDSGEGNGAAGWLGFGWALAGESRIERDTRTGTPYDANNITCGAGKTPCYRDAFVLDGQDLICTGTTCTPCAIGSPGTSCQYRTQSDDGRQIYYFGETNGWKIYDRDGRTLVYGSGSGGRLVNPLISKVFSWQLESSTDVNGNVITYQWDLTSSANIAYLNKILYGALAVADRSVEFILNSPTSAARPDKPVSARAGFRQQTDRRVVQIEVRAAANALVTRYDLSYTQDPDSTRSRLATVQRRGSDPAASLPPYTFEYSQRDPNVGISTQRATSFDSGCQAQGGLFYVDPGLNRMIVDMNRDGMGDVIDNGGMGNIYDQTIVSLSNGSSFLPGPGLTCEENTLNGTIWHPNALLLSHDYGLGAVLDFDGDGYPDSFHTTDGFPPPTGFRLGSASGFVEPPYATRTSFSIPGSWQFDWGLHTAGPSSFESNDGFSTTHTLKLANGDSLVDAELADVTGDGRPDMVFAYSGYGSYPYSYIAGGVSDPSWNTWTGWAVFVNRGWKTDANGTYLDFGTVPIQWPAAIPGAPISKTLSLIFVSNLLADENGDGLLDQVMGAQVSFGYGAGFLPAETHSPSTALMEVSNCTEIGNFDINGDGFLDHIDGHGATSYGRWMVQFGNGDKFNATAVAFPVPKQSDGAYASQCLEATGLHPITMSETLRDVDGDGVVDYVTYLGMFLNLGARTTSTDPNLPSASLPGLLLRATDPLGGAVEFTYQGVPQMKDANGNSANPGFGIPKPVVSRVRYLDGRAGTPSITNTYQYAGGTFDYAEKEFRGFGTVTATLLEAGQPSTTIVSTRRTDRTCAFALSAQEVRSGTAVISRESTAYVTKTGGGTSVPLQWGACLPSVRLVESVEGNEATKKVRRTSWDYGIPINSFYNVVALSEMGEWNSATNTDVPGDERVTLYAYAIPTTVSSIVSRVWITDVLDPSWNVVASTRNCYASGCGSAAAGGQVVAVQQWLEDPTANPAITSGYRTVASIVYDGWGNPTQNTGAVTTDDPNGLLSMIGYDTTYHTFPISISQGSDTATPLVTTLSYTGCAAGSPPPALGLPCSVTAPGAQVTNFQYDLFGRVTRVDKPASVYAETRAYTLPPASGAGQTILETRQIRSQKPDLVFKTFLDGLGRTYRDESPGKQSETVAVARTFDDRGRARTETLPFITGSGIVRTFSYDAIGRLDGVFDPDGITTRAISYAPWKVIDETYFGSVSASNRKERKESSTDGLGRLVRVAQYEDAVAASTPYLVTATYDAADRLIQVRDPIANNSALCNGLDAQCQSQHHVTDLVWDTLGRRVRIQDPDSGAWVFRYDDAGLLKERTQNPGASARSQFFTYDGLQRLSVKTVSPSGNGSTSAIYTYSSAANSSFGRLTVVTPGSGTKYTYGYDAAARQNSVLQVTAGKGFTSTWVFDELDRVSKHTFPDGEAFNYTYDGTRLATIAGDSTNPAFQGTVLKQAQFDALGRINSLDIGQTAGGAAIASVTYGYDANARLNHVVGTPGTVDLSVSFDGLGRLTTQTGFLGTEVVNRSFTYDGLSRLKTATGPWEKSTGGPAFVTWTYAYDAMGNLRTQTSDRSPATQRDSRTWSYTDAFRPHVLSAWAQNTQPAQTITSNAYGEPATVAYAGQGQDTLLWNAQGKLYQDKNSSYSWDAFDQNTLVVTGSGSSQTSIVRVGDDFEYDIGAGRADKYFSVGGVRIAALATNYVAGAASIPPVLRPALRGLEPLAAPLAAGFLLLGLVSLASVATRKRPPVWVSAPGVGVLSLVLVAMPFQAYAATLGSGGPGTFGRPAEPFLAYITDHLGSVRAVVNSSGTVVETRDYDPFGGDTAHTGTFSVQHRFTGQPADDQAGGLYNYGARFYNPKWGRFLSPDEVTQGFDSQGLNPFAYVENGPTSNVDPTGEMIIDGWSFGAWSISTIENNDIEGRGTTSNGGTTSVTLAEAMGLGIAGHNAQIRAGEVESADAKMQAEIDAELGKAGVGQGGAPGSTSTSSAFVWPAAANVVAGVEGAAGAGEAAAGGAAASVLVAPLAAIATLFGGLLYPREVGDGTLVFRHYTTNAARQQIMEGGGFLDPAFGSGGKIYVTPTIYKSGAEARHALELRLTPNGYFEIPQCRLPGLTPEPPTSGGGIQFTVRHRVDVKGLRWTLIGP